VHILNITGTQAEPGQLRPQLPAKVIRDRVLSRAQLETLVHALDATSSDLAGRYRVPERGLELALRRRQLPA
jgi:hypothetical protein